MLDPHLARQNHRDQRGAELQNHGLADRESNRVHGDPSADLVCGLNANDRPHEDTQKGHNAQALEPNGVHFLHQQFAEDRALLRTTQHTPHEGSVAADVEEQTHGTKVQANFAAMNQKGIGLCLALLALCLAGCTTTKASKGKCPTCPEWSVPSQPPR